LDHVTTLTDACDINHRLGGAICPTVRATGFRVAQRFSAAFRVPKVNRL